MSVIRATITAYFDALNGVFNANSTDAVDLIKTDDCTFALAPASFLREAQLPPDLAMPNAAWNEHIRSQYGAVKAVQLEMLDTVVDEAARKAAVHHRNHITLANGKKTTLENAVFLYFTEDGTKVSKIVEFTDAVATKEYLGLVEEAKRDVGIAT